MTHSTFIKLRTWSIGLIALIAGGCAANVHRPESVIHAMMQSQPTTLPSRVYNWNEFTAQTTTAGQRRAGFDSPTATLNQLEMHITTLNPGQQAHAPHRHVNEELIMLKEGTLEAMINEKPYPMPTGSVLFVAPNDLHVVKNVGTTPATYFVVTWRTPKTGGQ